MPTALAVTVAALALVALPSVSGCGGCGDLDCGSGVVVYWVPEDLPDAWSYRLCINGRCEDSAASIAGGGGQYRSVAPATGTADEDVSVRLELLDEAGAPTTALTGSGQKRGDCCPGVELRATRRGDLVVDPM